MFGINMDWIQIASAVGIGALLTKVIDVVWLQRTLRESEKRKWLRDKRLEAYSELTKEILSLGKDAETRVDPFKGYALASKTMLLVNNESLAKEIDEFFTNISNLYEEYEKFRNGNSDKTEKELEGAYFTVADNSRKLVNKLRESLHEIK